MAWDLGNVLEDLISRAVTNGSMDKRIGGGDEDGGMAMNLLGSIKQGLGTMKQAIEILHTCIHHSKIEVSDSKTILETFCLAEWRYYGGQQHRAHGHL